MHGVVLYHLGIGFSLALVALHANLNYYISSLAGWVRYLVCIIMAPAKLLGKSMHISINPYTGASRWV